MTPQELGQQLKIARERLGYDIKEAASIIKIDSKFVERMEEGDFKFLEEVYVRSFLKEYAADVLQLEAEEVLEAYKNMSDAPEVKPVKATPPPPPPPPPPAPTPQRQHEFSSENRDFQPHFQTPKESQDSLFADTDMSAKPVHSKPKIDIQAKLKEMFEKFMSNGKLKTLKGMIGTRKGYIILSAIIVGLILILWAIFSGKSGNNIVTDSKKVDDLIGADSNQFSAPAIPEKKIPANADTVILVVSAKDSVKMTAIIDRTDTLKFTLEPADSKTLNAAKRIDLRTNNFAPISLVLNDKPLSFTKKKGLKSLPIDKKGVIVPKTDKNDAKSKKPTKAGKSKPTKPAKKKN
ncbi:MAG: helix-turn-helix domain-containing protein [Ignavibacteriales bacterium]|nr:MAG: helix-turn-helix domain-containing protein [Ignavibacteriaceae bacterium]MBW7872108.1 helix-turn-helix domain-containing protein [Ignavibacteria bacterium]MCZ2143742.1 helix-turn-helix domain-containing protein [Ignavibacteriales bacterium]OQY71448.1 MAG: hypothetical protein B6D45_10070 [Ignavibacteriales bacterium UTCHB3]MBV6445996.1 hypothetical protein [Ignavibacteriaceae bacterium]